MTETVTANRVVWEGVTYDSQLEADWACTLKSWGIQVLHHPGRLLLSTGEKWEPDFITVPRWSGDPELLLEVKGPGNDRLWKIRDAEETNGVEGKIVILRPGLVLGGSSNESAGACWHGTKVHGAEWVLELRVDGTSAGFTTDPQMMNSVVRVSAERCIPRPEVEGIGMRKAVGSVRAGV